MDRTELLERIYRRRERDRLCLVATGLTYAQLQAKHERTDFTDREDPSEAGQAADAEADRSIPLRLFTPTNTTQRVMAKNRAQLDQPIADVVQTRRRTARAAEQLQKLQHELDTLIKQFHGDLATEIADATERLKELKKQESEAEGTLRKDALEYYEHTGDKKPHPGVEIKEFAGVSYDDDVAFERGADLGVLQLDRSRLDKMAKAAIVDGEVVSPLFDFVTPTIEGKVYLSKNISIDLNLPIRKAA